MALARGDTVILTLNSDASAPVNYLGTAAGIALGVAALEGIGRFAARRFPAAGPAPVASRTPVTTG